MIIHDLDHLESLAEKPDADIPNLLGGTGITIVLPKINLQSLVVASSAPPALEMLFAGDVKAGKLALLNVASNVVVRNVF
jgi:hypothetical protein